jgi:hypothetical protein
MATKLYSQEATVRIWRNVKTWARIPTSHFGHAAVTIEGTFVPGFFQHISFWPGTFASKGASAIKKQAGSSTQNPQQDKISEMNRLTALRLEVGHCQQNKIPYPSEYDDILRDQNKTPLNNPKPGQRRIGDVDDDGLPLWSQSPEVKVVLPGLGAKGKLWGLSTRRMGLWWQQFQASQPKYQALGKQNCAGVALMGLVEGGSEAFVECPGITIYGEPIQVEKYANELEMQMDRMEQWAMDLDRDIQQAVTGGKIDSKPSTDLSDGIWKTETWKKQSALGGLTVRSTTIREIDDAVEKFHQADWKDKFTDRYEALAKMFMAIAKHRQDKADSKRSEAVLRLAAQILAILRNPGPIW